MRRPIPPTRRPTPAPGSVRAKIDEQQAKQEIDVHDFEHTGTRALVPAGMTEQSRSLVVGLRRSSLESQLAFALHNPRQVNRAMEKMVTYSTTSEEAAATLTFSVPRGGKMIHGPSIRFAELIKAAWGHNKSSAHITDVNREAMYIEAEGVFHDLETNMETSSVVRRSIRDKYGKCFSEDMITITGNAACAIAKRNAILEGIPRPLWENAYEASKRRAAGGVEGLQKKRQDMLKTFMREGVAPDRVLTTLGVTSEAHIKLEHINTLRGMWGSYQSGEATIDELFPPIKTLVHVEEQADQTKQPKRRQTLADLGNDDPDSGAENRLALDRWRDVGRQAYHKGIHQPPKEILEDPVQAFAEVWQEGHDEAAEQERSGDDEDTNGATVEDTETEDRERYSRDENA